MKEWIENGKTSILAWNIIFDGIFIKHRQGKSSDAEIPFTLPRPIAETTFTPPRPIAQPPFFLQESDLQDSSVIAVRCPVSPTHTTHMTPSQWRSSLMVDSALEMCLFLPIFVHLGTPVGARAPGTYLLVYWVQPAHAGLLVCRLVFSNIDINIHLEHHSFRFKCYKRAFKSWSNKLH